MPPFRSWCAGSFSRGSAFTRSIQDARPSRTCFSTSWEKMSGPASLRSAITVAHLTLVEARRRRIVLAGAVCASAFLTVFGVAVAFAYREMMADAAVSFVQRQATLTFIMLVG